MIKKILGKTEHLLLEEMVSLFNSSEIGSELHGEIKNELIERYMGAVEKIAKRFSWATGLDKGEFVSEGNLILCNFFSGSGIGSKSPLSTQIGPKLKLELKSYAIDKILDILSTEPLEEDFSSCVGSNSMYEFLLTNGVEELSPSLDNFWGEALSLAFVKFDNDVKCCLDPREYTIFTLNEPVYGETLTLEEIGKKFGLTSSWVGQIKKRGFEKIRKSMKWRGMQRDFQNLFDLKRQDQIHVPQIAQDIRNLDQELETRLGTNFSRLVIGLGLKKEKFGRLMTRMGLRWWVDSSLDDLYDKYKSEGERELYSLRYVLHKDTKLEIVHLREKIMRLTGTGPTEFMAYFNLLEEDFLGFVKSAFPSMKSKQIEEVLSLGEDEKKIERKKICKRTDFSEINHLNNVLNLLQKDKYCLYLSNIYCSLSERLKHAFFPIYLNDSDNCLNLLKKKMSYYAETEFFDYFKETYNFFENSLELSIPSLRSELDDFQKADVLILSEKRRHILGSETGVGKSLEIIATAEYLKVNNILILTNKTSTTSTWKKEVKKHLGDDVLVITGDSNDREGLLEKAKKEKWVCATYDIYRIMFDSFNKLNPEMVVVDEADVMNNHRTQRTQAILNTDAKYKYCVSGWLFKNKRSELWPILNWLFPSEFPDRDKFVGKYCRTELGRARLKYELSHRMVYRSKGLVLPNLGDPVVFTVPVELNPIDASEYRQAETNFIEWYKTNVGKELPNGIVKSKLHALRRISLRPKFQVLSEMLERRHKVPNKSVVFCTYVNESMRAEKELSELGLNVEYFNGRSTTWERDKAISRFNNSSECEVLVMTEAGGKSIDLFSADYIYLMNPVWTYSMKKQIIDRLHRRGQKEVVYACELVTKDTLEEKMVKRVDFKRSEYQETITDAFGYTSWFEEKQSNIIDIIVNSLVNKKRSGVF